MSSSKVRKLNRVLDFTASWAGDVLTITTTGNHLLVTGDVVTIMSDMSSPQILKGAVTVTNGTVFTMVASAMYSGFLRGKVTIDFFRTGFTGDVWFTSPNSSGLPGVIQSVVTGTGGATTEIYGSLNGVNYGTAIATLTNTTVTGNSQSASINTNWAYISAKITVIGAATKLEIWYSA